MGDFSFTVQTIAGEAAIIELSAGQTLFVLGANGTGKSSLLQRLAASAGGNARRISASRQTWFQSSSLEFTATQKQSYEQQARNWDTNNTSRWMEQNAQLRSGLTLYDLVDAENVDARAIATALRAGDVARANKLAIKVAPIAKINELLALSNMDIRISVEGNDKLVASKSGGPQYGAAELSDGERNGLLVAADVLTAKPGTLLIIDEPERHLHRSIISPLLTQLFSFRNDCSFVIATHDLTLPLDNPDARVLLVRGCAYSGSMATAWDFDIIPANADVDESIKYDIVGARRKIVFVEGESSSLDEPLYSLLFPGVSVRPKGSSRAVENAVAGIRASGSLHWVEAWGIIDNDGRDPDSIAILQRSGVFALPFYSVESIYYHEVLILALSQRLAAVTGDDGEENARRAIHAAIKAVEGHLPRLAARAVEKAIRRVIFSSIPTLRDIEALQPVTITIDTSAILEGEVATLSAACQSGDWVKVLTRCPIRETQALDAIAHAIGLQGRHQFQAAILQMLREDPAILATVRRMFGGLAADLSA